ncbi:MAG: type VI secretion system membrane subunit TssM, partial [Salinisphaera sp.]|nr:type VI secretion system membrane subunit TssM [Salinisphaera sp.]
HRLLTDLVFAESVLAGVNWRFDVGRAVGQNVAYIAIVVLALLLVLGWFTSYRLNLGYLQDVNQTITAQQSQATKPVPASADFVHILPRLDALREISAAAGKYRDGHPLLMGLGLYSGDSVSQSAQGAYRQGLAQLLLPRVARYLEQQMIAAAREPQRLYRLLKAYLMLAQPEHLDRDQLAHIVRQEFAGLFAQQPAVGAALALHFDNLLSQEDTPRISNPAGDLITQARASLSQASVPVLMFSRLESIYTAQHEGALDLKSELGLGASEVFRRTDGKTLSDPIPALYTKDGFGEITGSVGISLVGDFLNERWVLGENNLPQGPTARFRLAADFVKLYENRYIDYWDKLLAHVELTPLRDVRHATQVLGILSGRSSPLRRFLEIAHEQTYFPPPDTDAAAGLAAKSAGLSKAMAMGQALAGGAKRPGERISEHFRDLHQLMQAGAGGGAPIDQILALLGQLYGQLNTVGSGLGERDAISMLTQSGGAAVLRDLHTQAERWPVPLGHWLQALAEAGQKVTAGGIRNELDDKYRGKVLPECRALVGEGRYPFARNSLQSLPLADFARLFGPGGVFESFFNQDLQALVDTTSEHWKWRTSGGASIGIPNAVLAPFQHAGVIQ